jgi:hypothetical protein
MRNIKGLSDFGDFSDILCPFSHIFGKTFLEQYPLKNTQVVKSYHNMCRITLGTNGTKHFCENRHFVT